jgi:hypothetical protein
LQFQSMNRELYHGDDKLVAVVRVGADQEAPRTALNGGSTQVFTSINDAETWLRYGSGRT